MSYTAKSVVFDIADNWGGSDFIAVRSIDFWYDGSKITEVPTTDFLADATSFFAFANQPEDAFNTSLSKTGSASDKMFACSPGTTTNQRLVIVFDSSTTFDEIRVNNCHDSGAYISNGAKNVEIKISTDSISSVVYEAAISNATQIYDSTFDVHSNLDEEDEQILVLGLPFDGNVENPEVGILSAASIGGIQIGIVVPETSILTTATMSTVYEFTTTGTVIRYFLTITGAADGLTDVDLPMSSFQSRRRSGDPTYLNVVIPSVDYIAYLTDRPNGTMIVSQGYEIDGEVIQREQIIETSIDNVNTYEGGTNNSIVLIGYTTTTYTAKTVTMEGLTYKGTVSGKTTYRLATPNIYLNPGDTVTIGTATFTAGVISYSISSESQQIEIEVA